MVKIIKHRLQKSPGSIVVPGVIQVLPLRTALEIVPCREVYSVRIVGLSAEIEAPAVQILYTHLHIVRHIVEEVRCHILSFLVTAGVGLAKAFA